MKELTRLRIKVRTREISVYDLEGSLESAIAYLQGELDSLAPGETNQLDWDSGYVVDYTGNFTLYVFRQETDEEFEKRKEQARLTEQEERRRKADQKLKAAEDRRKLYEELKREFE